MESTSAAVNSQQGLATASPRDSLAAAATTMRDRKVGSLVVVDDTGQLVGIVTERDVVVRGAASHEDLRGLCVADVMTTDVACCQSSTPMAEISSMMLARNIRHLPVLHEGTPVGMVSNRDVMAYQLNATQAMRKAAEDAAKLIKCLTSLELDEVLKVISHEVPKLMGATRWMLCMTGGPGGGMDVVVRQFRCHYGTGCGTACQRKDDRADVDPTVPQACSQAGAQGPRLLLPLGIEPGEEVLLCMCNIVDAGSTAGAPGDSTLTSPPGGDGLPEIRLYKLQLLQDVLNGTLANARIYERVRRRSLIDPLTGLKTRRVLEMKLAAECELGSRRSRPFCVAVVDIDTFKHVNDTFGHAVGDRILRDLGDLFLAGTRSSDVSTRFGGDEFVVVMPETPIKEAQAVLDRLRNQAGCTLKCPDGTPVTISCGVAEWSGRPEETGADVMARADQALYEAKRSGRNCVVSENLRPQPLQDR